jgi:hypothetical protein
MDFFETESESNHAVPSPGDLGQMLVDIDDDLIVPITQFDGVDSLQAAAVRIIL